jgi:hypothetical protein
MSGALPAGGGGVPGERVRGEGERFQVRAWWMAPCPEAAGLILIAAVPWGARAADATHGHSRAHSLASVSAAAADWLPALKQQG